MRSFDMLYIGTTTFYTVEARELKGHVAIVKRLLSLSFPLLRGHQRMGRGARIAIKGIGTIVFNSNFILDSFHLLLLPI